MSAKYDPPYNEEQMREHGYSEEIIERLKKDPVHSWRMKTGIELIHREPTKTELMRIWKNWQLMTDEMKKKSEAKCKELFGCTNKELYDYLLPQYKSDKPENLREEVKYPPRKSEEALKPAKVWTMNDIKSIEDLQAFYKVCRYGLVDWKAGCFWKETHNSMTGKDYDENWKLLSPEQVLKYRCGICYDTAMMSHHFLTKWKIPHQFFFGGTKRSLSDDYDSDATHTFVIYEDGNKWKWLEGSWEPFIGNNWSESDPVALIKHIGKAMANASHYTNFVSRITKYPKYGVNMHEFHHFLKPEMYSPQLEVAPDSKYSKEDYSNEQVVSVFSDKFFDEYFMKKFGYKTISFPEEEVETLSKQDRIITTRVSSDYDRFHEGDIVKTLWRKKYKVVKRVEITDIKDHPYYSELTKDQIEFLSKYDKIAVLTLMIQKEEESNEVLAEKGIKDGYLYHGSPKYYKVLKPQTQKDANGKKALSLSPYKSIASMFVVEFNDFRKEYDRCWFKIAQWFNDNKDHRYECSKSINIYHNIPGFNTEKVYKGYLYTVNAEEALKDATDNPRWKGDKEVLSYVPELKPVKVEQIEVKVIFKYDLEKCECNYNAVRKSEASSEAIIARVSKNIKNNLVYHASPFELKKLKGSATLAVSGEKGSVFVSPCKGLVSCFVVNKKDILENIEKQLGKRIVSCNFGYDVWNKPVSELYELPKNVTIEMNIRGFKPFKGTSTGYLYTIDFSKYKDKCHMFNKNPNSDVEFLIEGDVDYIKAEKITVNWTCVSSEAEIKRKGEGSLEELINMESLSDVTWSEEDLKADLEQTNTQFKEISNIDDAWWNYITEAVNLAAEASGDEKWTKQEVKDKITKNNIKVYALTQERYLPGKGRNFAGYFSLVGISQFTPSTMYISNVAIMPKFQGKGFGKYLIRATIDKIRSEHPKKDIFINVATKNNRAKSLYEKVGFKEMSTTENSIKMVLKADAPAMESFADVNWTEEDFKEAVEALSKNITNYLNIGNHAEIKSAHPDWEKDASEHCSAFLQNGKIEKSKILQQILSRIKLPSEKLTDATSTIEVNQYDRSQLGSIARSIYEFYIKYMLRCNVFTRKLAKLYFDQHANEDWAHDVRIEETSKQYAYNLLDEDQIINYAPYIVKEYGPIELKSSFDLLTDNYVNEYIAKMETDRRSKMYSYPDYWDPSNMPDFALVFYLAELTVMHHTDKLYQSALIEYDVSEDQSERAIAIYGELRDLAERKADELISTEAEKYIQEAGKYYVLRGFPVYPFMHRLQRYYNSNKLSNLISIVRSIGITSWYTATRTVKIHRFFVPEIILLLTKFKMAPNIVEYLQKETWLGEKSSMHTDCNINRVYTNLNCTLYPHQDKFIREYADHKDSHKLRGYLLSFSQGLGKTITSVALMEALGKERVVVICPKNTMVETWKSHFQRFYKKPQTIYVAGVDKEFTGQRFCIFNYDAIDKMNSMSGVKTANMGVIVDESHNFLRMQSSRTRKLIDLAKESNKTDMLLMSGTPIKACGVEMIPMLSILDPMFDEEAAQIFKDSFGYSTRIASDVLNARLHCIMERVTKDVLDLPPKNKSTIKIKLPDGDKYTVKEVRKGMEKYIQERMKFHRDHMVEYRQEFDECMDYLNKSELKDDPDFKRYKTILNKLIHNKGKFDQGDEEVTWLNKYEKEVVEKQLPTELLQKFRHSKAAIKYLHLKVRGEVLGQYLGKLRIEMTSSMLKRCELKKLIDEAQKKTIIFTSFVDTIETCEKFVKSMGYKPIVIYGKNSGEIAPLAKQFQTDPSFNPLIASLQTLSTGATLTAANRVIFLNKPWRSVDYEQASDRVHRIGQDCSVDIISLVLDTGDKGNLSTRMEDIMNASAMAFDAIVEEHKEKEDKKKKAANEAFYLPLDVLEECKYGENYINLVEPSEEGMTLLNDTHEQRVLNRMAKPHYRERGANSWEHVQQDIANGILLTKAIKHRDLTLQEYATILYHDCGCKSMYPEKEGHGLKGVEIAKPELKKCGFFTEKEIDEICVAILEHDETTNPKNLHSSDLSDLLASADTNPPDIPWILNKSYVWGLRHGETDHDKNMKNVVKYMSKIYGSDGEMIYPKLYREYYKEEIKKMNKFFDNLTVEECTKIVDEYREEHELKHNELTLPEPNTDEIVIPEVEVSSEMLLHETPEQLKLNKIAKPYYKPIGSESWQHIQQDVTNGVRMVKKVENRDITLQEYAAILFHDSACKSMTERKGHGVKGAEIAKKELSKLGIFSNKQIDEICVAIREHDSSFNKEKKYSSKLSDFLMSADSDPIDIPWIMNKYYTNARNYGLSHDETIKYLAKSLPEHYGTHGKLIYPNLYKTYYADRLEKMHQYFDHVTSEQIEQTILKYRKDHHLGENDRNFPDPSFEGMVLLKDTKEQRELNRLAKSFYIAKGQNSWEHIQQDMFNGISMLKKLKHRDITLQEYATILFHDCAYKTHPDGEKHGIYGAEIAKPVLKNSSFFSDEEIEEICQAIIEHDFSSNPEQKFSSELSDFLISADSNPINLAWIMNKCYSWGIRHGKTHEEAVQHVVEFEPSIYGSKGKFVYPKMYKAYYGDKIKEMQKFFDHVTYEQADKIITDYRKRHHLSSTDTRLPDPSLELLEVSTEGMTAQYAKMQFANNPNKKRIWDLSKKYYDTVGCHGVNHIQEVLATAYVLKGKKDLTDAEYAAIVYHDVGRPQETETKHHNVISVEIAKKELPKLKIFTEDQLEEIYKAILNHSHSWRKAQNIKCEQLSGLSELLAYADRGFPQTTYYEICLRPTLWILEGNDRSDNPAKWERLHHYKTIDDIAQGVLETLDDIKGKRHDSGEDSLYTRSFAKERAIQDKLRNEISLDVIKPAVVKIMKDYKYKQAVGAEMYSAESLEPSMEAADIKVKRKKIQDYVLKAMKLLDPRTNTNYEYWKNKFDSMSDKDFDNFMHNLRDGKENIHMYAPPFKVKLQNRELVNAAHALGVKLMHRLWMTDNHTGIKYLTPEEYMVLQLPVRRQQQFLDEKLSVPDNDKTIDGLTGQVAGDSKSCSITNPEIQIFHARNLDSTLFELANVRGGNIGNYAEFKRSLEETGEVSLNQLDPMNRTRVAVIGQVLMTAMHLDVNLVDI